MLFLHARFDADVFSEADISFCAVVSYKRFFSIARADRCSLAPDVGPGKAAFQRFYFDPNVQKCRRFIWGGVAGNSNNFKTRTACEDECLNQPGEQETVEAGKWPLFDMNVCDLPKESGMCMAFFPRWWFNKDTNRCEEFVYGGCQGTLV